jgi:hypothetical protein
MCCGAGSRVERRRYRMAKVKKSRCGGEKVKMGRLLKQRLVG